MPFTNSLKSFLFKKRDFFKFQNRYYSPRLSDALLRSVSVDVRVLPQCTFKKKKQSRVVLPMEIQVRRLSGHSSRLVKCAVSPNNNF